MFRPVLETLFPLRCAGCGSGAWPFCPACLGSVVTLSPPGCRRCGRPWEEVVPRCRDCPPAGIDAARAPFLYSGAVRAALRRLKFSGWRAVAEALGEAMAAACDRPDLRHAGAGPEAVTWVPLSGRRRAERGYDQARALARVVGRRLDLPVVAMLGRAVDTAPQARRAGAARRTALRNAFRPVPVAGVGRGSGRGPPARVLLVDDVLTTGATAAECAAALRQAGVAEVRLLTAARALSDRLPARCYPRVGSRLGPWLPGDHPR